MKRIILLMMLLIFACGVCRADTLYIVWNDAENMDASRPSVISVQVDGESVTVEPDADGLWKSTVTGTIITPPDVQNYTRRDVIKRGNEITVIYDHSPVLAGRRVGNIMQVEVNVVKNWSGVPSSVAHPNVNIVLLADGGGSRRRRNCHKPELLSSQIFLCMQALMRSIQ